jgi:hypothetical protein
VRVICGVREDVDVMLLTVSFCMHHRVQVVFGSIQCTRGTFLGGRKVAGTSPPSTVDVSNAWRYTFTPPYLVVDWCLVKHKDKFTFNFETCSREPG